MHTKRLLLVLAITILGLPGLSVAQGSSSGAVYTMTNSADDNQIVVFSRDYQGLLTKTDQVSTESGFLPMALPGQCANKKEMLWTDDDF